MIPTVSALENTASNETEKQLTSNFKFSIPTHLVGYKFMSVGTTVSQHLGIAHIYGHVLLRGKSGKSFLSE